MKTSKSSAVLSAGGLTFVNIDGGLNINYKNLEHFITKLGLISL